MVVVEERLSSQKDEHMHKRLPKSQASRASLQMRVFLPFLRQSLPGPSDSRYIVNQSAKPCKGAPCHCCGNPVECGIIAAGEVLARLALFALTIDANSAQKATLHNTWPLGLGCGQQGLAHAPTRAKCSAQIKVFSDSGRSLLRGSALSFLIFRM